jgi:hypothetical protein
VPTPAVSHANDIISTFCTSSVCLPCQPRRWFAFLGPIGTPHNSWDEHSTPPTPWPSPTGSSIRSHSARYPLNRSTFDHQPSILGTRSEPVLSIELASSDPQIGVDAMSASVSPSTADFSVFSTPDSIPDSIPSSTSSHTGTPKIRKRSRESHEVKVGQKRRKVIGRPKNGWTASRRRKLVRLYLMTNLEVDEIAKVLRTDNFKTWYASLCYGFKQRLTRTS